MFAVLVALFLISLFPVNIPKAEASAFLEYNALAYDGFLLKNDANYTIAHDAADAEQCAASLNYAKIGQLYTGYQYELYRAFVYFDTSSLSESAVILGANLTITMIYNNSGVDFNVTIQNGQPTYPSTPLQLSDYNHTKYSGNGGELDTTGISLYTNYNINITELSWITKAGTTKLCLRSSRDIDEDTPSEELEYVTMATADHSTVAYRPKLTVKVDYLYTFKGLFDEGTGALTISGVNVTAYFADGTSPTTFEVNGSYGYGPGSMPLYFHFELGDNDREYWVAPSESVATIYIFGTPTHTYNIQFIDLAGVLGDYPFVVAQRYVNGSLFTIEKRRVDERKKVSMSLINGVRYTLRVEGDTSYEYGDLLFTSTTDITITLKGVDFPQNIILAYQYVRLYAERHDNLTSISMLYEDLDENTVEVVCNIKYRNGTVVFTSTQYANSFNVTWSSADYSITYYVEMDAYHNDYGTLNYRAVMYCGHSQGLSLDWLGSIIYFNVSDLLPIFVILATAGIFSKANAYVGAFLATCVAMFLTWFGFISIAPGMLIMALFFSILLGLTYKKVRVNQ